MKMLINSDGLLDLVLSETGIVRDLTLETAYSISVLTDRRALITDELPFPDETSLIPPDRRGYVGDILDEKGRLIGSKLWLLVRSTANENTRQRAEKYVEEALQWAIDDGYVFQNIVKAIWNNKNPQWLDIFVIASPIDGAEFTLNLNNVLNPIQEDIVHAI